MAMTSNSEKEAEAFGVRAKERVFAGHVPDLRRVKPCDWFYNNSWRRPYLVDMEYGRNLRFAMRHLKGPTVLEIGAGLGHMALELARNGFHVTGLELSADAVEIARSFAEENPSIENFGELEYVVGDFLSWEPQKKFHNICFFGVLHHFENIDSVLRKAKELLYPDGRIVVVEPFRDSFTTKEAAITLLIRCLLSTSDKWYTRLALPGDFKDMENQVQEVLREFVEARDLSESSQSPNDNSAFGEEMLKALQTHFTKICMEPGFSSFYRIGGGIRAQSEEDIRKIADFLNLFDKYAVSSGLMKASEFLWTGRNG